MRERRRPSFRRSIVNFNQSDIPLPKRLVVASRNWWRRVALRQRCCGHDGEPGC